MSSLQHIYFIKLNSEKTLTADYFYLGVQLSFKQYALQPNLVILAQK